ncbi:hypothetical protein DMENIID0001_060460 [Sergentomyia squamirostris]
MEIRHLISELIRIDDAEKIWKISRFGKWVPYKLTEDQKENRVKICSIHMARQKKDPFLHRFVTCDEKWVLYDNISRTRQWVDKKESAAPTPRGGLHPVKRLLCVWWDVRGVIYRELLPKNTTLNADIYCQQLQRLQEALQKKRGKLTNREGVILQQDNARPHTAKCTQEFLGRQKLEVLAHPPCSPDVAPSDYHLFRLKHSIRGIFSLADRWKIVIEQKGEYVLD